MYKKIYLEITNTCNLNCPFCIKNNRENKFITIEEYKTILEKIKLYTKYLYLHVSGEPLMHPFINEIIDIGSEYFYINITTNGYLIDKIKDNHIIRQINISLHSYYPNNNISLENYLDNIIKVINNLHDYTYFSLRFWVNNKYNQDILNYLSNNFKKDIKLVNGYEIIKNVFISIGNEFTWPDLENDNINTFGTCYALKDHIGILVNGDVVPCCLDVNGNIILGNLYKDELVDIQNSKKYINMVNGFKNNKRIEKLCQKCNFLNKIN